MSKMEKMEKIDFKGAGYGDGDGYGAGAGAGDDKLEDKDK